MLFEVEKSKFSGSIRGEKDSYLSSIGQTGHFLTNISCKGKKDQKRMSSSTDNGNNCQRKMDTFSDYMPEAT